MNSLAKTIILLIKISTEMENTDCNDENFW